MPKIYKYVLDPAGSTIGEGQVIVPLSVGWQGDDLVLWAEAEDWEYADIMRAPAGIFVQPVPTGADRPPGFEYIGTAQPTASSPQLFGIGIVMHVYWTRLTNKG